MAASQVVLITGASSGLGRACAEHLAGLGHRVFGTSRRVSARGDAPSRGAAGDVAAPPLRMLPMDVRDDGSVQGAVGRILAEEGRIDVVVNNAGVGLAGSIEDTTPDEARELFETNFFGVHRVCRAVLPSLRRQGSGLIVNVSSLAGLVSVPFQGFYSASKFAVEALTEALRMELRPFGIRVAMLEPGDFRTGFTASRRFAAAFGEESPYAERGRRAVAVMEHDEQTGADARELARLLARLMERRSPRLRYPCGMLSQRLLVGTRRLLPASALQRGISAYYKL